MLREELKKQTLGYVVGALGLVAGLAWNEAIKGSIEYLFPLGQNSLLAKFVYALLITVVVVIFTNYVIGIGSVDEKK
ncbi:MAG: DUF5654 family protein [bacterium]|nr:DUF5654 family protein [bacterium]